ncbi:MAG: major capsid protein [Bacteroides sp.]|nr:major capsid protein [Bacteroides sp.]
MNSTLFGGIVDKYFRLVIGKITEKINGKKEESPLLHKTMLAEEYSADLNWGATELNNSIVAADVVSLDSSLPLKNRGKLSNASGKLPKMGLKYRKGEKDITDINVMIARGTNEATIASKVFDDAAKVVKAIDVRKEIMFLQGLSTGVTLVDSDSNDGTGIRVSFGYKPENTFHALKGAWSNTAATPQDDIQQMFDKAQEDGNAINHVYISRKYFDLFRKSEQGRLLAATFANQVITKTNLLPVPGRAAFLDALADEYGATFHIVNSSFKYQRADGKKESIRPWEEANIVCVPAEQVGRLVYGTLAEETNPVPNVKYQKSGTHILVSKYSKTDPLEEFTAGQALVMPVIDGADSIYLLHADATEKNELTVNPEALVFPATATPQNKPVVVDVHYDGVTDKLSAESGVDWATVTLNGDKLKIKVAANDTEAERTGEITVTDGTKTATVTVTQAVADKQ